MFNLNIFFKYNFVMVRLQPISQFNILNSGTAIACIKTSGFQKYLSPNGATTRPKGTGILAGVLMDIMMKQVLILRNKQNISRFIIIRADYCINFSMSAKNIDNFRNRIPVNQHISINEKQNIAACDFGTLVSGVSWTMTLVKFEQFDRVLAHDIGRFVTRSIIDHNTLKLGVVRLVDSFQAVLNVPGIIFNWNNDGNNYIF